jgi:cyclic pyranopterin phosphate synthase
MRDAVGRTASYLRLSITKACGMRCLYCRPERLAVPTGAPELSAAEIETLVSELVRRHGLRKVRITGGEPTMRDDLPEIVARLVRIDGLADLALTTNGLTLHRQAGELAQAGLKRVNVSLDSLDREGFRRLTGVDGLSRVLNGIETAISVGLKPLKLNAVVIRGENDHELKALLHFAVERGLSIRFIELMPMGPLAGRWRERFVSESEMRERLTDVVTHWEALPADTSAARLHRAWLADGRQATVGFISAMSCPFCRTCDRIRISANGSLYPCLMDRVAVSLLPGLRPRLDADLLDRLMAQGLNCKAAEHPARGADVMTHIGG